VRHILFTALGIAIATLPTLAGADALTAIIQKDLTTLGYDTGGTDGEMTVKTAVAVSKFQSENNLDVTGEITPQLAGIIKAAIGKQGQAAPVAKAAPVPAPAQAAAPAATMPPGMDPAMVQAMMQAQGGAGMDPSAMQAMMQGGMDPAMLQAMMAQMAGGSGMDPAAMQAMQAQAAQTQAAQTQAAQQACLQQKMAAAQEAQKKKRGLGSLMRAVSRIGGDKVANAVADVSADVYAVGATVADLESAAKDLGLTETDVEACRNAG
jgi:peptidoglycan hydrolase-like protein with peptidoglycan-binding domain